MIPAYQKVVFTQCTTKTYEWPCSTGADLTTDPMTLGSVVKVIGSWEKRHKNSESVMKSPTGGYSYRQDVLSIPTRCRLRDVFCSASCRSTTTSTKPLTDKPDHKQTSRKGKQTSQDQTLPNRTDCFCGSVFIARIQNRDLYHTI